MVYENILQRLLMRESLTPYLENAMITDKWPDSYNIKVDTSPYYGHGDGYFHPSSHPMMGARQLYLMFHPDTRDKMHVEPRRFQSQMIFAMGTALHSVVQTQFQMAGLVTSDDDIEFEYVNREHHVRGRIDFIVDHPDGRRIPVEMKTINSWGFSRLEGPKDSWLAQLNLGLDNSGYDEGILLVVERGDPFRIKEIPVTRDDKLLSEIYGKFDYVRECIDLNTPPKPCCALDSNEMKSCPARFQCWMREDA